MQLIDAMLTKDRLFTIALPRLPARLTLERAGQLEPRVSVLDEEFDEAALEVRKKSICCLVAWACRRSQACPCFDDAALQSVVCKPPVLAACGQGCKVPSSLANHSHIRLMHRPSFPMPLAPPRRRSKKSRRRLWRRSSGRPSERRAGRRGRFARRESASGGGSAKSGSSQRKRSGGGRGAAAAAAGAAAGAGSAAGSGGAAAAARGGTAAAAGTGAGAGGEEGGGQGCFLICRVHLRFAAASV